MGEATVSFPSIADLLKVFALIYSLSGATVTFPASAYVVIPIPSGAKLAFRLGGTVAKSTVAFPVGDDAVIPCGVDVAGDAVAFHDGADVSLSFVIVGVELKFPSGVVVVGVIVAIPAGDDVVFPLALGDLVAFPAGTGGRG